MADRVLNMAGSTMAALIPLVLGLAVALVQPSAFLAVLVLWGFWLIAMAVIVALLRRWLR